MSLITLIDKHKTNLAIPLRAGIQEIGDRYIAFGQELAQLPSFTYTRQDMEIAVAHMTDLGFNHHARYSVAAHAVRRAAVEAVPDVSARQEIFGLMSLAMNEIRRGSDSDVLREAVQNYIMRAGKSKTIEYLLMVQREFEIVAAEVDALSKIGTPIAREAVENHGQRIPVEKLHLKDILDIVKEL